MPSRLDLINSIAYAKRHASAHVSYLEIGIRAGGLFTKVAADRKVGVDPCYAIPIGRRMSSMFRNILRHSVLHKLTSDEYFQHVQGEGHNDFDIVFIDGMHTYEQSLRDICNSVRHLKPGGIILIHDCLPPHAAAATSVKGAKEAFEMEFDAPTAVNGIAGWDGVWCGDVWKSLVHCHRHFKSLSCSLLDTDMGIGVIVRSEFTLSDLIPATDDSIDQSTYSEYMDALRYAIPTVPADDAIPYVIRLAHSQPG